MTVAAPPKLPPVPPDPEALIEEARRRARRRRLKYAAAGLLALALGGAIYGAIALTGGSGGRPAVPAGYELVHARGLVSHAVIVIRGLEPTLVVDPATGSARPVKEVWEAWFDRKSGLERVREAIGGRHQYDVAGRTQCIAGGTNGAKRFCLPPGPPFDLTNRGFTWPLKRTVRERIARELGRSTFRGRSVIWVAQLTNGKLERDADRVAIDARTHRLVAYRRMFRDRVIYEQLYTSLDAVPGGDVDFVVPKRGEPSHSWPPAPPAGPVSSRQGLPAASNALGRAPLWLGRRFRGNDLQSISVEMEDVAGVPVRLVTFDYGKLSLLEFRQGVMPDDALFVGNPPPGRILLAYGAATAVRDGLLVQATPFTTAREAVLLAKALRPTRSPATRSR